MTPRLQSLELHGYKTFANRVTFGYPADITAIVGPNGSGKSNIADAIRWVLGEQSYSLLRGRKTEDMIFAGSEQRPRASMASVTITFDNDNGWLPIDFNEVSITRRAYRDGQNEYLLNGQRVRLKDISELLAMSGLAERTYTIIGQGLVDAALSLKPEERRRFFEEAAGIGLYRSRREESLNRLDQTRRNLERVQDILGELQPRLQSLERQARRVQEYERIKADLRLLLREWYGYHFHRAQGEFSHTREVLHVQEHMLGDAREKLNGVVGILDQQRDIVLGWRAQLNSWHTQSADLHRQREAINRSLAVMDERRRSLFEQKQHLQGDLARVEEEYKASQVHLDELGKEVDWLTVDLREAQQQYEMARKNLENRQSERSQAEDILRASRQKLVTDETRQVQMKAHLAELENRLETQSATQHSLQQTIRAEEMELEKANLRLEVASEGQKVAEGAFHQLDDRIQDLRRQLSDLGNVQRSLQEDRAQYETEHSKFRAHLEVLEQADKSMSGINQGARFLMQEVQQKKLSGSYHMYNQQLEVPVEYETAITAVLGDFLDGIVVEQEAELDHALFLLGGSDHGKAVLISIAELQSGASIAPLDDPDYLGCASDLVRYSPEIRPVVLALLGQVLVVRNHTAARRLVKKLPESMRLVTLQGEVFWGRGIVQAGRDNKSGVIGRPRQRKEIESKLRISEEKVNALAKKIADTDRKLGSLRSELHDGEKSLRQADLKLNQENQAFQQASLEMEKVRQRQDWQRNQLSSLNIQLQHTTAEIMRIQGESVSTRDQITFLNDQVNQHSKSLAGLPLDDYLAQVAHWNTSVAVADRALMEAGRRLKEFRQSLTTNQLQQENLEQGLKVVVSSMENLEIDHQVQRELEAKLNADIAGLQMQIIPAEMALNQAEGKLTQIQEDQLVAQQVVMVAERHTAQAQLELSRSRDTLDSLQRRIEEDFGLVAFEYASDISGPTPLPLDGMVEQLPVIKELAPEIEDAINRLRTQLRRMGAINLEAQTEFQQVLERYEFLTIQVNDLHKADADLRQVIAELDELMRKEFRKTFDAVAVEFRQMFTRLFGGGSARLLLTDADDPNEAGIEIETRLPGRREQGLSLLSGGERSLTAVALVFALLKVSPTPFCVLDEVDAMLDEANVSRFRDLLVELSANTQFVIITHNRNTVQAAGVIYGVTMGRDSASQVISLRLDELSEEMAE